MSQIQFVTSCVQSCGPKMPFCNAVTLKCHYLQGRMTFFRFPGTLIMLRSHGWPVHNVERQCKPYFVFVLQLYAQVKDFKRAWCRQKKIFFRFILLVHLTIRKVNAGIHVLKNMVRNTQGNHFFFWEAIIFLTNVRIVLLPYSMLICQWLNLSVIW